MTAVDTFLRFEDFWPVGLPSRADCFPSAAVPQSSCHLLTRPPVSRKMTDDEIIAADVVAARRNDVLAVAKAHAAKLRGLQLITKLLVNNATLSSLVNAHFDVNNNSPPDLDEADWLIKNGLINGHTFDDSSLPYPSLATRDGSLSLPHNSATVNNSSPGACVSVIPNVSSIGASLKASPEISIASHHKTVPVSPRAVSRINGSRSSSPGVRPAAVASPAPDEVASLSDATKALVDSQTPKRPAKTVHLPAENVQAERFRERREALDEEKAKSELDHSSRQSRLHSQNEVASSPSSTVGALSAATPGLPQDSPDTSPDSEAVDPDVLLPKDLLPDPEEQRAQQEHDRLLAAQKDIAHRHARGDDDADPGDQLRWEEREAAAREAAERTAREKNNAPEPGPGSTGVGTEAQEVMEGVQVSKQEEASKLDQPSTNNATTNATPRELTSTLPEDEETITVARPTKVLPQLDTDVTNREVLTLTIQPTQPESMMEREGSKTSVTMNAAGISSEYQHRRQPSSPDSAISPMSMRHPQESKSLRTSQPSMETFTPHPDVDDVFDLGGLAALKGAAEDPDRDYLEPLFRIQAHDSPNGPTKSLPNLVKDAAKCLSTQDQFATLQERLDYRILRRIYQLQNANKWSLRQMERCKEPEQPVTHWDHMMSEMKWMRKDFNAERKTKKAVCAWLAGCCAKWVAADQGGRQAMQIRIAAQTAVFSPESGDQLPELETFVDSAPEDNESPPTPRELEAFPSTLIVPPELSEVVTELRQSGCLGKALQQLPIIGLSHFASRTQELGSMTSVSKFVDGKVLPKAVGPIRKRSRYEYEDDANILEDEPGSRKLRVERYLNSEDEDVALFHPDNKHIRDRLHANNAFRPPSEFVMPSTSFYEFRNGSQWIWEDDQKLRKLAKEYSFNWSLIAEEMVLPSRYKSAAERRTPWECFERWVELETLPAEMRKTMYFKTWFQRLEQSQQAAERRYQAQVAAIQQAANGAQTTVPMRRRTIPSRVEKRKNSRYLWLVDAMRKHARKRENNAYKQAETQRAAAQRKAQADNNTQPKAGGPMPTPQEFSKRRHERDLQIQEHQRAQRQKLIEAQQKQVMMARAAQQGGMSVAPAQQRNGTTNMQQPSSQLPGKIPQVASMNGQLAPQVRPAMPMSTHNGHLAVPQVGAQGVPQAQMRASTHGNMPQQGIPNMNAQGGQYGNQQYQMTSGATPSPGNGITAQQHLQTSQQQMLAQMNAQTAHNRQISNIGANGQPMSNSPSMPPPPTPHGAPQQLSSGHVPALFAIKNQLKARHPSMSDDQLNNMATTELRRQSQNQNATDARQNAINAAAGVQSNSQHNNMQAYAHNQNAFQSNHQMAGATNTYIAGENASQPTNMNAQSPQAQQAYAAQLRARQLQQMRLQGSPGGSHAVLNGSPGVSHASPNITPASPSVQYSNMNGMNGSVMNPRPPSRSNTPQIQRLGSSGMASGMQSPGSQSLPPQGSPRNMQASMAR
nr:chromatin modification-related protein eaf1 [Quercus suber]